MDDCMEEKVPLGFRAVSFREGNYPRSLSESFKQNSGPRGLINHYDLLVRTPSDETLTLSIFRTAPAMKSHVSIIFRFKTFSFFHGFLRFKDV